MSLTLLAVTYELAISPEVFERHSEQAAVRIAETPGLRWKIWGLDPETGAGTSIYLFTDATSAAGFANGPAIAALAAGPARNIATRIAPVHDALSALTHAASILEATTPTTAPI